MPASAHLQPHTAAVFVDCVGSGLMLSTNIFMVVALLKLAHARAGCDGDDDCRGTIFGGFRPSAWITMIQMLGQLGAALAMPLMGATTDYTTWTREAGSRTAWAMCAITALQGLLLPRLLVVSLLQAASLAKPPRLLNDRKNTQPRSLGELHRAPGALPLLRARALPRRRRSGRRRGAAPGQLAVRRADVLRADRRHRTRRRRQGRRWPRRRRRVALLPMYRGRGHGRRLPAMLARLRRRRAVPGRARAEADGEAPLEPGPRGRAVVLRAPPPRPPRRGPLPRGLRGASAASRSVDERSRRRTFAARRCRTRA